jgi:glycosyltransferase involved in cell wall biosynthesis
LRVLVTPDWYPWPDEPLAGVFCREQARAIARSVDVRVLAWRPQPRLRALFRLTSEEEEGVLTYRLRHANSVIPKSGLSSKLAGLLKLCSALRRARWRPDVIHAHEFSAASVAVPLGVLTGAPLIFSEHWSGFALGTLDKRERRLARWAFSRGRLVCPVSADLARHVAAVAPDVSIRPVPNVVDTDLFVPPEAWRPEGALRLVTVGSLVPIKGPRHLIAAVSALRERGVSVALEIIGDGPLRADLERFAADLDVADAITFRGRVDRPAVAAALRRSDAFVLPSLWETLSCALLEAMAAGLPAVATRVGGIPEVLTSGEGILVEPGSTDALAEGLLAMAESVAKYDRRSLRQKAVASFGYDAIAREWADVYASVVDDARGNR